MSTAAEQARPERTAPRGTLFAFVSHTVRMQLRGVIIWGAALGLYSAAMVASFTAIEGSAQQLNQLKARLAERFGREVFFVSISVDSEYDTPERLKEFALKHQATHPGWTFLTGKKSDVDQVIARLGQYVENIESHSTVLIAGNEKRRHWLKLRPDMPSAALAERLRLLAEER